MPHRVEILQDVEISPKRPDGEPPAATYAFPFLCRLATGEIVCAFRRGQDKHSRDGVLLSCRSTDGGWAWSEPIVVHDGTGKHEPESVHAGVVGQDREGTVLALFKTVEAKDPQAFIFSEQGRTLRQRFYVARSLDRGETWSPAEPGTLPGTPRDHYVGTRPVLLADGRLFLAIEATDERGEVVLGSMSSDNGATWEPAWTCAADADAKISHGDPRIAQLPDGRLLMMMWTWITKTEETLSVHACSAKDGGRTWSKPASTGVPSQIMAPLSIDGGRLVAVSNVRKPPQGIRLWVSSDCGQTWSTDRPIQMWDVAAERMLGVPLAAGASAPPLGQEVIWDALPSFSFGLPDLVNVGKGQFVLTYYATIKNALHVRACRFQLVDF